MHIIHSAVEGQSPSISMKAVNLTMWKNSSNVDNTVRHLSCTRTDTHTHTYRVVWGVHTYQQHCGILAAACHTLVNCRNLSSACTLQLLTDCHMPGAYYMEHTMTLSIIYCCILVSGTHFFACFPLLWKQSGLTYEFSMLWTVCPPLNLLNQLTNIHATQYQRHATTHHQTGIYTYFPQ
jgi:hypothetical protein